MDATQSEYKLEVLDVGNQVLEHTLGLGDVLLLEPLEHLGELEVLERDPRQDCVLQRDHRTPGLPGCATTWPKLVAVHTGLLELHHEEVLADLRVVVVHEVALVLGSQLLAETDHVRRLAQECLGLVNVIGVVPLEHLDLLKCQHGADLERQLLDAARTHVELQHLQTGGPGLVVEVVDLEQVDLLHEPLAGLDVMGPPGFIIRTNDGHRLCVQSLRIGCAHAK